MAKSGGNAVSAVKATEQYGADVLRLYVASLDYADDVRMSEKGIKETSEAYRKIRNTFRYLLGNLEDYARFDPEAFRRPETLHEIDKWALGQLNAVIRDVTESYERSSFTGSTSGSTSSAPWTCRASTSTSSRIDFTPRPPTAPTVGPRSTSWPGSTRTWPGSWLRSSPTPPRNSGTFCPPIAVA